MVASGTERDWSCVHMCGCCCACVFVYVRERSNGLKEFNIKHIFRYLEREGEKERERARETEGTSETARTIEREQGR